MENRIQRLFLVVGLVLSSYEIGIADDSVSNTSTVTTKSIFETLSDYGTLNFFGTYRGAALNDLGNSLTPTPAGDPDPTTPQQIESLVTGEYKFTKDLSGGMVGHFYYYPAGNPVGNGQDIQMLDPWFILNKRNIVNANGFKLNGRFTAELPLVKEDLLVSSGIATALTTALIATYEVPRTSLTLGLFGYLRGYVPTADAIDNVRTYKVYMAPNANYQLSENVSLTLWVDLVQTTRNRGTGFLSGMTNAVVDIEPGINWDITKNISINPILNIYPSNPTLAATSIQAFIVAKAF